MRPRSFRPCFRGLCRAALAWALAAAAGSVLAAAGRCVDEPAVSDTAATAPAAARAPDDARAGLLALVRHALRRSDAVGAATLLAQAADDDTEASRAAMRPQLSLNGAFGPGGSRFEGLSQGEGLQARAGLTLGALLYDGGRTRELTAWRERLADAARLAGVNTREQVALQTVSLAIERSRYRQQVQVYRAYDRQMMCLVQALDEIVAADRGRQSEQVQARKNEQQALLLVEQSESALRQIEIRLQRLVGTELPPGGGAGADGDAGALLLAPPPLADLVAEAGRASDIASLAAQADAQDRYARAVAAETKPQIGWSVTGSQTVGSPRSSAWTAGLTLNVPLISPGAAPSTDAARKRAEAARLQLADALESRRARMAEIHEQARAAFERAERSRRVVDDSDRLRQATLQQWQQLGRRSLFDVMSAENEHYALRVAWLNALHDGQQSTALLRSLGRGLGAWLDPQF